MKEKRKNFKTFIIIAFLCFIVLPVVIILVVKMEGEAPTIKLTMESPAIGLEQELSLTVTDQKSGLRKVWVGLLKDGEETDVFQKLLPSGDWLGGGKSTERDFSVPLQPRALKVTDGKAILRIVAIDNSWRNWGKGNRGYFEQEITIDLKPPQVEVLSKPLYINQGGAGLVIYKISEPCKQSGVLVGSEFFPGYAGLFDDINVHSAFVALDYSQSSDTNIIVQATDAAGNQGKGTFFYRVKKRKFKQDQIRLSDGFLKRKMPEFQGQIEATADTPLIDQFLYINRDMRQANYARVTEISDDNEPAVHWKGAFVRLPASAPKAGFADHRKYLYQKKVVDKQVHLGVDLASVARSTVPAANHGKVVLADNIGIYGNTVIIDHGYGVRSMYSHLSQIGVSEQQMVNKGDPIGKTGSTGLAGGDHLHFSMLVHHTFVNPIEWWDGRWIKHNITDKIEDVRKLLSN